MQQSMNQTNGVQDVSFSDIDWASMGSGQFIVHQLREIPNPSMPTGGGATVSHSNFPGYVILFSKPLDYLRPPYDQLVYIYYRFGQSAGPFYGSSVPNPFNPRTNVVRLLAYPQVRGGTYILSPYRHHGLGPALLLNHGGPVPIDNLDPNNGFSPWAVYIEIHAGSSENWTGSAGCLTIDPAQSGVFFLDIPTGNGILITPEIGIAGG